MSNLVPFDCPVDKCQFHNNKTFAERTQIRKHLVLKHDYSQWQQTAEKYKLIPKKLFRSRGYFINLLCEFGILRGKNE